jgi:hypothetical protein
LAPLEGSESMRSVYAMLEAARADASRIPTPDADAEVSREHATYDGTYQHPLFGVAKVSDANGLQLRFQSGVVAQLHRLASDSFKGITTELYLPSFEIRFIAADDQNVNELALVLQPGAPEIRFVRDDA